MDSVSIGPAKSHTKSPPKSDEWKKFDIIFPTPVIRLEGKNVCFLMIFEASLLSIDHFYTRIKNVFKLIHCFYPGVDTRLYLKIGSRMPMNTCRNSP